MLSSWAVVETLITAGVFRVIVTVNVFVLVFPRLSEAVQVTVVTPTGNFVPEAGSQSAGSEPSTASVAETVNVSVLPNGSVVVSAMLAGTVTTGPVVSTTVTWNAAVEVFPAASLAVQLTVVVPSGNVEPDAGVQAKLVTPTLSVAEAEYETAAPAALVASAVMSDGTVITGGVVSACWVTVTVNDFVAVFPWASVAVHVIVVVPTGNFEPEDRPVVGADVHVDVTGPSTRSVADGAV
jgi:hypothetical protein